jgi:hypothetical protein
MKSSPVLHRAAVSSLLSGWIGWLIFGWATWVFAAEAPPRRVGFLRLEMFTKGDGDVKKAISTGDRQLVCHAMAANVSKNRFGITEPIEVKPGVNPLAAYLLKGEKK